MIDVKKKLCNLNFSKKSEWTTTPRPCLFFSSPIFHAWLVTTQLVTVSDSWCFYLGRKRLLLDFGTLDMDWLQRVNPVQYVESPWNPLLKSFQIYKLSAVIWTSLSYPFNFCLDRAGHGFGFIQNVLLPNHLKLYNIICNHWHMISTPPNVSRGLGAGLLKFNGDFSVVSPKPFSSCRASSLHCSSCHCSKIEQHRGHQTPLRRKTIAKLLRNVHGSSVQPGFSLNKFVPLNWFVVGFSNSKSRPNPEYTFARALTGPAKNAQLRRKMTLRFERAPALAGAELEPAASFKQLIWQHFSGSDKRTILHASPRVSFFINSISPFFPFLSFFLFLPLSSRYFLHINYSIHITHNHVLAPTY